MIILGLLGIARAAPLVELSAPAPCATPVLLPRLLSPRPLPPPPGGTEKGLREAIDGVDQVRVSENFALKWGAEGGVDEATAAALLEALEQSWQVQMVELEHPGPYGSDDWRVNVYVEDTGLRWTRGGTSFELSGSGAAGYFYSDPEGHPMLVMSTFSLQEPAYAGSVAAHELYHAVQAGLGAYGYGGQGAWYWEATASWMAGEVFPEVSSYADFLFGFALLPWLGLDFFDYPDTGALQEFHQYGAFIFPRHVSEHLGGAERIRDTWVQPDEGGDPIAALERELGELGTSVGTELAEMAVSLAMGDYEDGAVYLANIEGYAAWFPEGAFLVADLQGAQLGEELRVEDGWLPRAYGYNLLRLRPGAETRSLRVQVEAEGSRGSSASWSATLGWRGEGAQGREPVSFVEGEAWVELPAAATEAWLALVPVTASRVEGEVFGWSLRALDEEDDGAPGEDSGTPDRPDDREAAACGCASSRAGAAGPWLITAALAVLRSRRRGPGEGRRSGAVGAGPPPRCGSSPERRPRRR